MKKDFNRDWTFYNSNGASRTVHLPHDAMLEEKRQMNCHNGKIQVIFRVANIHM